MGRQALFQRTELNRISDILIFTLKLLLFTAKWALETASSEKC
ncbi:hypothetical protein CLOSTMETH_03872 [[Clostridium] methylpentosum DSM 5476]|uniref:Uncharacterized protein n=1 Tax=[Clostridium] methylpentosum DSM 5476 TaxID=537013 RepID=C0EJ26_9FIRM|nr:hypothetical protein CLOSTMETH_03872 [[Clostridium] methylpentosum DSM 5476]